MDKRIENIFGELDSNSFNVFKIGTSQGKDFDLVIIGNGISNASSVKNLKSAIELFGNELSNESAPSVVLKMEHFGHVSKQTHPIHLLFYPTVNHFYEWELFSFVKYVSGDGKCLFGSKSIFDGYEDYKSTITDNQFMAYSSLACSICIYSSGIKRVVPRSFLSVLFRYTLRHTVLEVLYGILNYYPFKISEQIKLLKKYYPIQKSIPGYMKSNIDSLNKIPEKRFNELSFNLFEVIEKRNFPSSKDIFQQ